MKIIQHQFQNRIFIKLLIFRRERRKRNQRRNMELGTKFIIRIIVFKNYSFKNKYVLLIFNIFKINIKFVGDFVLL